MNVNRQNDIDPVEMLGEVARMEAPPFLLTRIRQKVADVQQRVPAKWVVATALSMVIVVVLNIYLVAGQGTNGKRQGGNELAEAMNLLPKNALYE
jgi:hypothetical protein